jgi:hypothetical protein
MFHLVRLAIWIIGLTVVTNFLLNFFDHEIDWDYVKESQSRCFGVAIECQKTIQKEGAENAKCPVACFEFGKLVRKK